MAGRTIKFQFYSNGSASSMNLISSAANCSATPKFMANSNAPSSVSIVTTQTRGRGCSPFGRMIISLLSSLGGAVFVSLGIGPSFPTVAENTHA